eukprot:750908-Hanusia_phi.AAC.1
MNCKTPLKPHDVLSSVKHLHSTSVRRWKLTTAAALFFTLLLAESRYGNPGTHGWQLTWNGQLRSEDVGSLLSEGMKVLKKLKQINHVGGDSRFNAELEGLLHSKGDTRLHDMKSTAASALDEGVNLGGILQSNLRLWSKQKLAPRAMSTSEFHKAIGMRQIEGHGSLDGMSDDRVPFVTRAARVGPRHSSSGDGQKELIGDKAFSKLSNQWQVHVNKTSGLPVFVNSKTGEVSKTFPVMINQKRISALMIDDAAESDHGNVHGDRFKFEGPGSTLPKEDPKGIVDPKTGTVLPSDINLCSLHILGVVVSRNVVDFHRMLPLPWYDESSTIQNQRNALRVKNGPNSAAGGSPEKLEGLGINLDEDPLQISSIERDQDESSTLKDQGVSVSHYPFNVYKAVPNVIWDQTQVFELPPVASPDFEHAVRCQERRTSSYLGPETSQELWHCIGGEQRKGVKVNAVPELPPWSEEVKGESRSYVDGMFDRSMDVTKARQDFIQSSPVEIDGGDDDGGSGLGDTGADAQPIHQFLNGEVF